MQYFFEIIDYFIKKQFFNFFLFCFLIKAFQYLKLLKNKKQIIFFLMLKFRVLNPDFCWLSCHHILECPYFKISISLSKADCRHSFLFA